MIDITTIDWDNNFSATPEIVIENKKLKTSNWILFSLTIIVVIGCYIYADNLNKSKSKSIYEN